MNQNVLEAKKAHVSEIQEIIKNNKSFVVAEYRGLNVSETIQFKRALAKSSAKCSVFKNTMVHRASKELGYEDLSKVLEGPNTFIYAEDPIVGPKEAAKFAKTHPQFVIKGGLVDGRVVSADEVKTIAKLPGREGLLSMLLSVLQAPVRNFACAVKAVADKQQ